ncbi:MAG: Fic family protein [Limisphaerales bacterium]
MNSFRHRRLAETSLPTSTVWLLTDIAEAKGLQELHTRQSPQVLRALKEQALIQSVESSNRIEGVTVEADRLRPLVLGRAKPQDRPEHEIFGYRQALNRIHTGAADLPFTAETLLGLHRLCQESSGDAGEFKRVDNEIIEHLPGEAPRIRFRCLPAKLTPAAVDELCLLYRHAIDQDRVPPLVAAGAAVFDFLCIHPFRDGNGRVSRLLTLLLLYQHGYEVGRYISLERLVEESLEDYYEALRRSSERWHEGRHDLIPWINHFLAIIRRGYTEFAGRADATQSKRGAKTDLIHQAISGFTGTFSVTDLERACPGVSRDLIRARLKDLRAAGAVVCLGKGPGARWRKEGNNPERG